MKKITFFAATLILSMSALSAVASTVQYQMQIDGDSSPSQVLTPGTHVLSILGQVVDNEVSPGINGGLLQSAINLSDSGDQIEFEEDSTIFGPTGDWKSTFNSTFSTTFKGLLNENGFDVFEQTGQISPGSFGAEFQTLGVGGYTELFSGNFEYAGGLTTLALTGATSKHLVGGIDGSTPRGVAPTTIVGTSITIGIPEPATIAMAGVGLIGIAVCGFRRRK